MTITQGFILKKTFPIKISLSLFFSIIILLCFSNIPSALADQKEVKLLILGDSISAGLGVEPEQAYPFIVQKMLNEKGYTNIAVTNGSISGSTTAGTLSRLKWFQRIKPDILILALGANDGLRGLSVTLMEQNLEKGIVYAKEKGMIVILAGMKIPPNYGPDYASAFENTFITLSKKHTLAFIPFLLENVAGNTSLNQADGIHPNLMGHKIIANTVLNSILEQL